MITDGPGMAVDAHGLSPNGSAPPCEHVDAFPRPRPEHAGLASPRQVANLPHVIFAGRKETEV